MRVSRILVGVIFIVLIAWGIIWLEEHGYFNRPVVTHLGMVKSDNPPTPAPDTTAPNNTPQNPTPTVVQGDPDAEYAATRAAWIAAMLVGIAGAEAAARHASSSPHGYFRKQLKDLPPATLAQSDAPWARQVRLAADPGEPMLAVPFEPSLFLLAGRPPMNRYVYYLPWDADYTRHPWLGIQHDLCADVERNPPPVIYDNGWIVWDKYDPAKYMACLTPILARQYRPMPDAPHFFVRADRAARVGK